MRQDDERDALNPDGIRRPRNVMPTDAERQAAAIERAGKKIGKGLEAVAEAIDRLAMKLPEPKPAPAPAPQVPTGEETGTPRR